MLERELATALGSYCRPTAVVAESEVVPMGEEKVSGPPAHLSPQ